MRCLFLELFGLFNLFIYAIYFIVGLGEFESGTLIGFAALFFFTACCIAFYRKMLAHREKSKKHPIPEYQTYKERWLIFLSCTLGSPLQFLIFIIYALNDILAWIQSLAPVSTNGERIGPNNALLMNMGGGKPFEVTPGTSTISDRTVTLNNQNQNQMYRKGLLKQAKK